MFKIALVLLILLLGAKAVNVYAEVGTLVSVTTKNSYGSGVPIQKGLVLTAAHMFDKKGVFVNDQKAIVLKIDKDNDLMLLSANVEPDTPVEFADPIRGEEIINISYPIGIEMEIHGRVAAVGEKNVIIDANLSHGSSGSGIFNKDGKCIGIVSSFITDSDTIHIIGDSFHVKIPIVYGRYFLAVSPEVIQEFLKGTDYKQEEKK